MRDLTRDIQRRIIVMKNTCLNEADLNVRTLGHSSQDLVKLSVEHREVITLTQDCYLRTLLGKEPPKMHGVHTHDDIVEASRRDILRFQSCSQGIACLRCEGWDSL